MMNKILAITPSVSVWTDGDSILFDRKFYDGMLVYKSEWPGTISCIMNKSSGPLPSFGIVRKIISEIPFHLTILNKNEKINYEHIKNASIVLASGDCFNKFHVSRLCKINKIKCVYTIEYIPETRYQIIDFEVKNPIIKFRKYIYIWNGERKRISAFKEADGIQASGTAAYNEYHHLNNCILYFDTRVDGGAMISHDQLEDRLAKLTKNRQLRLGFSGRLIRMKGADHLIKLAGLLKRRNIDFKMTIFGTGDLEAKMMDEINDLKLNSQVSMPGAVDFYNELLPEIKEHIDLYVLLHRQSDPSCTYLETTSCGIPIVGYENKAFSGLLQRADVGWGKQIDDLTGIADAIEFLSKNKELIKEKSRNCITFSLAHDFKSTFQNRILHLRQLVE
ncbi:MAG: glycosyltransferase [Cyanothece sp. SIO2G6]|nr:glycosyltransferase [Cyanothece sp. SIO2G6]